MSEEQSTESTEEAASTEAEVKETLYPSEDASDETTEDTNEAEADSDASDESESKDEDGSEDKADDKSEDGDKSEDDKEAGDAEVVAVEDLEFPEGVVSEEKVTEFVEIVNDLKNLSPKEAAQKLVDFQTQMYQDQFEAHQKQVETWAEETKSGKLGGEKLEENLAVAAKARDLFKESHPEMTEAFIGVLDQTGVGNHPAVIEFFYNIGNAVSEDSFVKGSSSEGSQPKSTKDILYPNS